MEKFNVYDEGNSAVRDAYALLTANVHFQSGRDRIKTIAVTSWEPGTGKTTVAINLAISLAKAGWTTLLIDSDLRKPAAYKRLNEQATYGLTDVLRDTKSLDQALLPTNIANLTYLPVGGDYDNPIELLCSATLARLIEQVKEFYEFILFDTPALSSVIDGALVASSADGVLLVAQMNKTKLTSLKNAKEQLEKAQTSILGVVVNKIKKRDYVKYMESYNYFARFEKEGKVKA